MLDIRNSRRPEMYNIDWVKPPALVERYLRLEADERLDAEGGVVKVLDTASVEGAIARLRAEKVESVAVCLLNSFVNPVHERRIGELRAQAPARRVGIAFLRRSARSEGIRTDKHYRH